MGITTQRSLPEIILGVSRRVCRIVWRPGLDFFIDLANASFGR